MRSRLVGVMVILLAWTVSSASWAAEKVALIIGNGAYSDMRQLPNAGNDARLLHRTLTGMGFDAGSGPLLNLTKGELERALRDFSSRARGADIAVIYYAGHGMEAAGNNYLIPTDAELAADNHAQYEAVPLSMVMSAFSGVRQLGFVLLDACRDNPFRNSSRTVSRSNESPAFRNIVRAGSLNKVAVGFAAQLGALASDGAGRNSPYAEALAAHLPTPGLGFAEAFARVGQAVERKTGAQQSPHLDARAALLTGNPLVEGTRPLAVQPKPQIAALAKSNVPVLVVDGSGGGDYRTIKEAVAAAKAGTRIEIMPGRYTGGVNVSKPLELVGKGARSTIIWEAKDDNVIYWTAPTGRISNLTLVQTGSSEDKNYSAVFFDSGTGLLESSELTSKASTVVFVEGSESNPVIRNNIIRDGNHAGIRISRGATGFIVGNEIFRNHLSGIIITGNSNPTIVENNIRDGKESGIYAFDKGMGTIENNIIQNNGLSGVSIKSGSNPVVRKNEIKGNTLYGIRVWEGGQAQIFDNDLRGYKRSAIKVGENAGPVQRSGNRE